MKTWSSHPPCETYPTIEGWIYHSMGIKVYCVFGGLYTGSGYGFLIGCFLKLIYDGNFFSLHKAAIGVGFMIGFALAAVYIEANRKVHLDLDGYCRHCQTVKF